ncbi:MAG: NUDIX hydrolase [Calditrichaceae bacterium]|nr:NUDIX hydrolase [Calditrichaceae bacterium]MBN2709410.1 NUDIX hydrolase [Calditrichaceae bacterium]RQV93539.1 MAG: NUDIX hydrolase [Calditrichota bacterium]
MNHKNPWKKISSRNIYRNNWINIREDQVITPTGTQGIYGVVETKPAIGVVPVTENLDTFLVGQYRYTLDFYSWEIPEGGGQEDEAVLDGARRELREETGLTAFKWTNLGTCHTSNSFTNETAYLFLAEGLKNGRPNPDHTEELSVKQMPFLEAWAMVKDGTIQDAMSIIGLMRARDLLIKQGRI